MQQMLFGGGPPMPSFIDAGAGTAGIGGATISPAFPSGIVAGQFLIAQVYAGDTTAPAVTTPSGWTSAGAFPSGANVYKQWLFWKVADGSESGTLAISLTADTTQAARIYRFSNGSGIEAAAGTRSAGGSTTIAAQNITTLDINRLAIQMFGAVVNTTIGSVTGESGTDYTEVVAEFAAAQPVIISFQAGQVPTPTAITGGTVTLGASGTQRCAYGAAIIP